MAGELVAAGCLLIVLLGLAVERVAVSSLRRRIPVRIVVTGMRGKSSVTRLIAAGLRAGDHRVVYKTTGSAAVLGDPYGGEHGVRRWGGANPLEQRSILLAAVRWHATMLVAESMSIRPESLKAELRSILVPQVVAITNVGADHIADQPEPLAALAHAIPEGASVFCPSALKDALFAERDDLTWLHGVETRDTGRSAVSSRPPVYEWPENVALALAVCDAVGVPADIARRGMERTIPDIGALSAWTIRLRGAPWVAVNAFAANDPESTMATLRTARELWAAAGTRSIGLLNLRRDRGDRTQQWRDELRRTDYGFDRLCVVGDVPRLSLRRLGRQYGHRLVVIAERDPDRLMAAIARLEPMGGFLFGFGNIGGLGLRLVRRWSHMGEESRDA